MKKLLILIVLVSQVTWGQMPPAVQQDMMNFEPGELIVKLKDNIVMVFILLNLLKTIGFTLKKLLRTNYEKTTNFNRIDFANNLGTNASCCSARSNEL